MAAITAVALVLSGLAAAVVVAAVLKSLMSERMHENVG
jgi:hypothetical protein